MNIRKFKTLAEEIKWWRSLTQGEREKIIKKKCAKYFIIDEKAIRRDIVQNGEREIPGVRIFQETNTSYRS